MNPLPHNHLRGARGASSMALLALCLIVALWVGRDSLGTARAGTVVPAFVQAASAHSSSVTSLAATPTSNVTAGNRCRRGRGVEQRVGDRGQRHRLGG